MDKKVCPLYSSVLQGLIVQIIWFSHSYYEKPDFVKSETENYMIRKKN